MSPQKIEKTYKRPRPLFGVLRYENCNIAILLHFSDLRKFLRKMTISVLITLLNPQIKYVKKEDSCF